MNKSNIIRTAALAATAALALATGCSPAEESVRASTVGMSSSEPAPLCAKAGPTDRATTGDKVVLSQGIGWSYHQEVPTGYDGTTAVPLVITFGSLSLADGAITSMGSDAIVLSVSEPGRKQPWSGDTDQVRFVRDLLLRAESQLCFDLSAVYVVGAGGGEILAASAVRDLGDRVRPIDDEMTA